MALTIEQQSLVELQEAQLAITNAGQSAQEAERHSNALAIEAARLSNSLAIDAARSADTVVLFAKQAKLEAVRVAKEMLTENHRNLPVGEREVSAADIVTYAGTLVTYINS